MKLLGNITLVTIIIGAFMIQSTSANIIDIFEGYIGLKATYVIGNKINNYKTQKMYVCESTESQLYTNKILTQCPNYTEILDYTYSPSLNKSQSNICLFFSLYYVGMYILYVKCYNYKLEQFYNIIIGATICMITSKIF